MVKATDFVSKPCPDTQEKYVVTCGYCGKKFKSKKFSKAVHREGVHRADKHVDTTEKITTKKRKRHLNENILENWFTVQLHNIDYIWYIVPMQKLIMFSRVNSLPTEKLEKNLETFAIKSI